MVMNGMPPPGEELDEGIVEEVFPEEVANERRRERRRANRDYPKPEEKDVLELKEALEGEWHEWRYGSQRTGDDPRDSEEAYGVPGVERVRTMRYHRDRMPEKYRRALSSNYRFRSNWTDSEIERTVALATRNPPQVIVPPSSDDPDAQQAADSEMRWAQFLLPTLERQSMEPLLRMFADGLFEGGLAFFEVFMTDAYDDVESARRDGEGSEDYMQRTDSELRTASMKHGLPVGVRVPDPMAVLVEEDDLGICRVLVVEEKPYRTVFNALRNQLSPEKLEAERLPKPGTEGWPQDYQAHTADWGSPGGNVVTIRYYDRRWYGFMVAGRFVDGPIEHGMPGVPVICSWGNATSSGRRAERIKGIAAGMVEMEQAINDLLSAEADIYMSYGRPHPFVETSENGQLRDPGSGPQNLDLSDPSKAPELMPGQRIRDAFGDFASRMPPHLLDTILQIRERAGINPVASGESPGSDPSGFSINSLQAASQMRYEILIDNYARAVGMLVDFIRRMIKEGPISDKVFVPVENEKGTMQYLGLGPDEISDMPAQVFIDPMNDVNRLAIRQSLIAGHQAGYVPKRVVQTQGYGADDHRSWDNEIAVDIAEDQLIALALEEAKMRVAMRAQNTPQLVDAQGNPLSSDDQPRAGDSAENERNGGEPRRSREPAPGRMGRSDGGAPGPDGRLIANASRGGQAPANQGAGTQAPAGGRGGSP